MSNILKCQSCGQYYDMSVSEICPNCNPHAQGMNRTIPVDMSSADGRWSSDAGADIGRTVAVAPMESAGRTVAMIRETFGINPVVAWLVCIDGKEKGRDYRILDGNNKIGRSNKMDICILGDDTISREDEAIVTYASAVKKYYIIAGKGGNVVYVNGDPLLVSQSRELNAYDKIQLGKTTLIFIPFVRREVSMGVERATPPPRAGQPPRRAPEKAFSSSGPDTPPSGPRPRYRRICGDRSSVGGTRFARRRWGAVPGSGAGRRQRSPLPGRICGNGGFPGAGDTGCRGKVRPAGNDRGCHGFCRNALDLFRGCPRTPGNPDPVAYIGKTCRRGEGSSVRCRCSGRTGGCPQGKGSYETQEDSYYLSESSDAEFLKATAFWLW